MYKLFMVLKTKEGYFISEATEKEYNYNGPDEDHWQDWNKLESKQELLEKLNELM